MFALRLKKLWTTKVKLSLFNLKLYLELGWLHSALSCDIVHFCGQQCDLLCTSLALWVVSPSWFSAWTPYALKSQLPQRDPRDGLWVWWVQAGSQPARRTPWSLSCRRGTRATASEYGEYKLVLSLHAVRPEVWAAAEGPARRPLSMVSSSWFSACTPYALKLDADTRRTNSIVSMTLSPRSCHTVNPVHGHYTGQPALAGTPVKNGRILLVQSFTIRYDTRCYFNVRSKANMSQLNLPHGTDN